MSRLFLRILGIVLLSLMCSELALRYALPKVVAGIAIHGDSPRGDLFRPSADPALAYEMYPAASCLPPRCPVPFFTNRHGFRDEAAPQHSDLARVDVVVLGDSVTVGQGVPFEDLFWVRLSKELEAFRPPRSVRTAGLAVGGYETSQELVLYRRHQEELKPRLVLLAYVLNDRFQYADGLARWQLNPPASVVFGALHLAYAFGRDRYLSFRPHTLLGEFKRLSVDRGFRPVVVVFPYDPNLNEVYPLTTEHELVRAAAEGAGIDVIDLLDCMKATDKPSFDLGDQVHPNITGHRAAGRCIAKELTDRGFL